MSMKFFQKVQPSSLILWNIVNVLASYTFLVRRHVGDLHTNEAISSLFTICKNLSSNQNFESKETAIESVVYHANGVSIFNLRGTSGIKSNLFYSCSRFSIHFTNNNFTVRMIVALLVSICICIILRQKTSSRSKNILYKSLKNN